MASSAPDSSASSSESSFGSSGSVSSSKPAQRKSKLSVRQIIGGIFLGLFIAFLIENTKKVDIRVIGPIVNIPIYLALLGAGVLGALATLLLQHRRHKN